MTVEAEDLLGRAVVQDNRNYIVRHWTGALSLGQSYWVNGVLIGMPFNLYNRIALEVFKAQPVKTATDAFVWLILPFLLMQPLFVWQGVGIWRSAGNSIAEGNPGWAWAARSIVLLNIVFFVIALLAFANIGLSWLRIDQAPYKAALADNAVSFSGEITPASAERVEQLLKSNGVDRLVIQQSAGGLVAPALRLAETIKDRKLTVVAVKDCASMCTILLAAGTQRFISPETIIRLHMASIIGTGQKAPDWDRIEKWYVAAGAGKDFLVKIRAHVGPTDLYEPTIDELIANGLVTAVFDVEKSAYTPAHQWCDGHPRECRRSGRGNIMSLGTAR